MARFSGLVVVAKPGKERQRGRDPNLPPPPVPPSLHTNGDLGTLGSGLGKIGWSRGQGLVGGFWGTVRPLGAGSPFLTGMGAGAQASLQTS